MERGTVLLVGINSMVAEWLRFHFGDPVRFPRRSVENAALRMAVERHAHPARVRFGMVPGADSPARGEQLVRVVVPGAPFRNGGGWVCLSRHGARAWRERINDLFNLALWSDALRFLLVSRGDLNACLDRWRADNGISPLHSEAVRQRFYRMRRVYDGCGIYIGGRYKVKRARG